MYKVIELETKLVFEECETEREADQLAAEWNKESYEQLKENEKRYWRREYGVAIEKDGQLEVL